MRASVLLLNVKPDYLVSRGGPAYWVRAKGLGTDIRAHTDIREICECGCIREAIEQGLMFSLMSSNPYQLEWRNTTGLSAFLFMRMLVVHDVG